MDSVSYHLQVMTIQLVAYLSYRWLLADLPLGHLKRVYLLAALAASFFVPGWITIDYLPTEQVMPVWDTLEATGTELIVVPDTPAGATSWLYTLYFLGYVPIAIGTGTLFVIRVSRILWQRSRALYTSRHGRAVIVVLPGRMEPYTFGRWIFHGLDLPLSPGVLAHEYAHAFQGHTFDRLAVRLLMVVCWFNPVLYLYERAIIHNHELLADRTALRRTRLSAAAYRRELYDWLSLRSRLPSLASSLTYSFTKDRFLMLSKNVPSRSRLLLRSAALTCCWVLLLFAFARTGTAQTPVPPVPAQTEPEPEQQLSSAKKEMTYGELRRQQYERQVEEHRKRGITAPMPFLPSADDDLTLSEWRQKRFHDYRTKTPAPPSVNQLKDFQDPTRYRVWIDGLEVPNARVANYQPADIFLFTSSEPRYNPKKLTSIGLITLKQRAKNLEELRQEAGL